MKKSVKPSLKYFTAEEIFQMFLELDMPTALELMRRLGNWVESINHQEPKK